MLGILQMGEDRPRKPILPEAALMWLREHQELYARWLCGPDPWRPGDVVTVRRDCPIGGHGGILMVVEIDRQLTRVGPRGDAVGRDTTPPSRSRRTGLREDVRVAFVASDDDSSIRAMWIEGWMLEPWSVEQAEQHQRLTEADMSGRAQ